MRENSLAIQWLGLFHFSCPGSFPAWELRSYKPCGATRITKKKKRRNRKVLYTKKDVLDVLLRLKKTNKEVKNSVVFTTI